jgi:hypothetical protein
MKTPDEYAASGTEHGNQVALFMWANMAGRFGLRAAEDPKCYVRTKDGTPYAKAVYGTAEAIPELLDMFAIPNGGLRDPRTAASLKAEGVKSGVPDVFLPIPRHGLAGLFIELKRPTTEGTGPKGKTRRKGSEKQQQSEWIERLQLRGYGAITVVGYNQAKITVCAWLGINVSVTFEA